MLESKRHSERSKEKSKQEFNRSTTKLSVQQVGRTKNVSEMAQDRTEEGPEVKKDEIMWPGVPSSTKRCENKATSGDGSRKVLKLKFGVMGMVEKQVNMLHENNKRLKGSIMLTKANSGDFYPAIH